MGITGTHLILYTSEPDEVRAILRDVFGWAHVDAGGGWLIFALPPAELGVHPAEVPHHQVSLTCDDLTATMAELTDRGVVFRDGPLEMSFGVGVTMVLPGELEILLYEPSHPTPG